MIMTLRDIIRRTLNEAEPKRPVPQGAKGPRGMPPQSWGGRRVYDKKTGEEFDVVEFLPRDPDEEVEKVILAPRSKAGKKKTVSYDQFLGNYLKHSGQPVKTPIGSESPRVASWAWHELKHQGGSKSATEYAPGGPRARGPVDIGPSGEFERKPSSRVLDADITRFEDEIAMDKIDLAASNFAEYKELVVPYVVTYKKALRDSIVKAQKALKNYGEDMLKSGELDEDEIEWLKSTAASEIYAGIWELPNFHEQILPEVNLPAYHISTISSIVSATGRLAVSKLDEPKTTSAIETDPGFVTWLSKVDKGAFWNKLRRAAEEKGIYRGQF